MSVKKRNKSPNADIRAEVTRRLSATKLAYDEDVARFKDLAAISPGADFKTWMSQYGYNYTNAHHDLQIAQHALATTQSDSMDDIKGRLSSMLAARSPTIYTMGQVFEGTSTITAFADCVAGATCLPRWATSLSRRIRP
jgi:RecJ-like exonuclease